MSGYFSVLTFFNFGFTDMASPSDFL